MLEQTAEDLVALAIQNLRSYRWDKLWNQVSLAKSPTEIGFKALMLAAWWQDKNSSRLELKKLGTIHAQRDDIVIYCIALTSLNLGDQATAEVAVALMKRRHAAKWLQDWVELELLGRSRKYNQQARCLLAIYGKGCHDEWPMVAILQSLNQPSADYKPVCTAIGKLPQQIKELPLVKLTVVRWMESNNEIEYKQKINQIVQFAESHPDLPIAAYYAALEAINLGMGFVAATQIDRLLQSGFVNTHFVRSVMRLASSHAGIWNSLREYFQKIETLTVYNQRLSAELSSIALIHSWVEGDMPYALEVMKKYYEFVNMGEQETDRAAQVFFRLILALSVYWQKNQNEYIKGPSGDVKPLFIVGESHCLIAANANFLWGESQVVGRSQFVMGVKMHHLANEEINFQKSCLEERVKAIPMGSEILFTIGEIDCRPNEGIWMVAKKYKKLVHEIVYKTVTGYVAWVAKMTDKRFSRITLQGIPAPVYPLKGRFDPGDMRGFLCMIRNVNELIKSEAIHHGWSFLDVYAATSDEKGIGHGRMNIDAHHLSPKFYQAANVWRVNM